MDRDWPVGHSLLTPWSKPPFICDRIIPIAYFHPYLLTIERDPLRTQVRSHSCSGRTPYGSHQTLSKSQSPHGPG